MGTLGRKTKQSVMEVHANMKSVSRMMAAFLVCTMKAIAAPVEHKMRTL